MLDRAGDLAEASGGEVADVALDQGRAVPRSNSLSSLAIRVSLSLGRPGDAFDRTPASPRSRHWRRHLSTDRSLTRSAAAVSRFFCPPSKRSTACSRTRSRAALPAS